MEKLINRNPFVEFDNLFRSIERNLDSSWRGATAGIGSIPVDIYERPDAFYIRAAVPGAQEEDVELTIEKDVVTLKGHVRCDYVGEDTKVYLLETPYGTFTRSVRLPESCDSRAAEAFFNRGVLTVRIPKAAKPSSARSIPIRQAIPAPTIPSADGANEVPRRPEPEALEPVRA